MEKTDKNFKNLVSGCEHCGKEFSITGEELSMYGKIGIELPVLCFFCRIKLHLSFWLFGKFRKGKSDLSGENLITVLPENARYPIYTLKEWYSDAWEAMDYGMEYNPDVSFFEQLKTLQEKVPRPHQSAANNTGCEWSDDVWNSKNCYLSRSMEECEDLLYSYRNVKVKNSIDVVVCFNSERCYDCSNCDHSYRLFYSKNSRDCVDSHFLFDCRNCTDCFMCWNLRGKSFCIENIQYNREEYKERLNKYKLGSYIEIQKLKNKFEEIVREQVIHRENFNYKTYNSDGNFLINTKNCHNCFTTSDTEDSYNHVRGLKNISCIDTNGCWYLELCGNCSSCVNGYNLKYCLWSPSRNSEYLDICIECDECFGCVGIKKKKNCILNRQYTEEEYKKLKEQIISDMRKRGEYGKFFPYSMSPGPFNFSTSFTYFPETPKEYILKLGGYWQDVDESHIEGMSTDKLPDSIDDITEDICSQPLICPESGWWFNISQNELSFYKQNNIPLPRHHFDIRIKKKLKYLTVLQSYPTHCFYCKKEINAYYPPDWGYKNIACEECYQRNLN
jgi:hypothetical protein